MRQQTQNGFISKESTLIVILTGGVREVCQEGLTIYLFLFPKFVNKKEVSWVLKCFSRFYFNTNSQSARKQNWEAEAVAVHLEIRIRPSLYGNVISRL